MSVQRIARRFEALRAAGRKALVPFITAGDPGLEDTVPVMHAMVAAGADAIELGVPFSDPMADGPTIQRSSERALARGAGMAWVLEQVREFRRRDDATPVTLMGYLNPVEIRGPTVFAAAAAKAGVDGVLLVDLPPEEAGEFREAFAAHGVALVLLASPTTGEERMQMLCSLAQGYLYYVSMAGVTGDSARLDAAAAAAHLRAIRARSPVPVVVGFGIHDAASAAAMAVDADGVVVGSALVKAMDAAGSGRAAAAAAAFLSPLRRALDAGAAGPVG
ncbi:MAG: tryptophan synthase subunit alpha [Gammaproteobacteria bacterium]|jgi:tryptophan synthase alpha chain|nr:tryptophan synthase subunit alpha [Gammaproteobacteria bacterium]